MGFTTRTYVFLWSSNLLLALLMISLMSFSVQAQQATAAPAESLPYYNSVEFTPHWLIPNSKALNSFHKIPAFSFTNQLGETITQKTVANKIYVASFFFTSCPGICPAIRSKLAKVHTAFVDDESVLILSHSIDPGRDTVAVLKRYAEQHGIESSQWHLLTGNKNEIYKLAQTAYFAHEDLGKVAEIESFLHTESLVLIDQAGHIRGIYNGLNNASIEELIGDIDTLKREALPE